MTAHISQPPFEVDPLIAEAKHRARQRRLFAGLALLGVAAIASVVTLGLRPGGFSGRGGAVGSVGVNATPSEVAAIERAVRADPSSRDTAQLWFTEVRISTIDPSYAYVHLEYTAKCPGCKPLPANSGGQGGIAIVRRNAGGWHETWAGSVPPWCGDLPTAVRQEFFNTAGCPPKP